MNAMHEVDYKIFGEDLQYVEIELDPQEAVVANANRRTPVPPISIMPS